MGVIFDLDQTLIDSSISYKERRFRKWDEVYGLIPQYVEFSGIDGILKLLNRNRIPISIVSDNPEHYCKRVISHMKWKIDFTVCYHDIFFQRPNIIPIKKAITLMGGNSAIGISNSAKKILTYKAAGIAALGVNWGTKNADSLKGCNPDMVCENIYDLQNILIEYFHIKKAIQDHVLIFIVPDETCYNVIFKYHSNDKYFSLSKHGYSDDLMTLVTILHALSKVTERGYHVSFYIVENSEINFIRNSKLCINAIDIIQALNNCGTKIEAALKNNALLTLSNNYIRGFTWNDRTRLNFELNHPQEYTFIEKNIDRARLLIKNYERMFAKKEEVHYAPKWSAGDWDFD